MSFDISSLDIMTAQDQGAVMEVVDPRTGQVARGADGNPVTITLLGRYSAKARDTQRKLQNRRLDQARRGRSNNMTAEEIEAEANEILVACTVAWSFDSLDGQPFPCNEANARKFWNDPRFRHIREQADTFVATEGNFSNG